MDTRTYTEMDTRTYTETEAEHFKGRASGRKGSSKLNTIVDITCVAIGLGALLYHIIRDFKKLPLYMSVLLCLVFVALVVYMGRQYIWVEQKQDNAVVTTYNK
jgi:hypothetical protein